MHREVAEEAGIKITGAFYHGMIDCYHGDDGVLTRVHIFSSRSFEGQLRSSSEGEVRWFDRDKLPFEQMWKDVRVWLNHVYSNDEFEVTVKYNNKVGETWTRCT